MDVLLYNNWHGPCFMPNIQRQLPYTYQYLFGRLEVVEFFGHDKFAENTSANIIPILLGLSRRS